MVNCTNFENWRGFAVTGGSNSSLSVNTMFYVLCFMFYVALHWTALHWTALHWIKRFYSIIEGTENKFILKDKTILIERIIEISFVILFQLYYFVILFQLCSNFVPFYLFYCFIHKLRFKLTFNKNSRKNSKQKRNKKLKINWLF